MTRSRETDTYVCHGFNEKLPQGRASGQLMIEPLRGLRCEIGGKVLILPFEGLQISAGGANDRLIFIAHPMRPDWQLYVSDRHILRDPKLLAIPSVAASLRKTRHTHHRGWLGFALVVILIVALPLLLLLRMDVVSGLLAKQVPLEWEQSLGEASLEQYRVDAVFMDDEQVQQLIAPLVQPLRDALTASDAAESSYRYRFYIVDNSDLNAFALPGGMVVIHSGLILRAQSAEELLGVLAHEMIHVEAQHGIRNVIGSAGIYVIIGGLLGDANGVLAALSGAAPMLLNQSYSRRFEREADEEGAELLVQANINPMGLLDFFATLSQENGDSGLGLLEYLSTHPSTESRIEHLRRRIERQRAPANPYRDLSHAFATLVASVQQFAQKSID